MLCSRIIDDGGSIGRTASAGLPSEREWLDNETASKWRYSEIMTKVRTSTQTSRGISEPLLRTGESFIITTVPTGNAAGTSRCSPSTDGTALFRALTFHAGEKEELMLQRGLSDVLAAYIRHVGEGRPASLETWDFLEFGLLVKDSFASGKGECPLRFILGQADYAAETPFFVTHMDGSPAVNLYNNDGSPHRLLSEVRRSWGRAIVLMRALPWDEEVYCDIRFIEASSRMYTRYNLRYFLRSSGQNVVHAVPTKLEHGTSSR